MSSVNINLVHVRVRCGCGETVDVILDEEIDAEAIEADAYIEAEEKHGWGDGGFCPSCEREYQAECAADAAMREAKAMRGEAA